MAPDECASMRSMARCVLPVLVGPSTAVTPAPGARSAPYVEGEKAMWCRCFFCMPSLNSQVPDLILRRRASGVSKDEWHQWGFMVRPAMLASSGAALTRLLTMRVHHWRSEAFLLARRQIGRICFILRRRC